MRLNEIKDSRKEAILKTLSNYGIWVEPPADLDVKRRKNTVKGIVINDDETVSIDGSVSFERAGFRKLPVKFRDIDTINCDSCEKLDTLLGFPETVRMSLYLAGCINLKSLEHGPTHVHHHIVLERCVRLESLNHFPKVGLPGELCSVNINTCLSLRTIKGLPANLPGFLTMEWFRGPSLEGMPEEIGTHLYLGNSKILSLDYLPKRMPGENSTIDLTGLKHAKNFLAVFKVRELCKVDIDDNKPLEKIMNKHLAGDRDIMDCQEEMIEAGFEEYARLK